jgi:lipopolysaccharide cholinephosphotransferase
MNEQDLKKLKDVEMEVMNYYVDICKKHNLTYYLFYGSLLGCIRHKGFIPWDDDIDVVMPPDDYLKFLKIMENEHSEKYYLQNVYNTECCPYVFSKIRKYHTTMVEKDMNYLPLKKGINIDIFPLIKYPKSKYDQIKFMYRFRLAALLVNRDIKKTGLKNKLIYGVLHLLSRNMINKIVIKKMNKLLNYNKDFDEYRIIHNYGFKKDYFVKEMMPFENKKFLVPKDFDAILTKLYGDYMTPPPKNERFGHGKGNILLSFDKEYDEL